jgi:hypothetical protein
LEQRSIRSNGTKASSIDFIPTSRRLQFAFNDWHVIPMNPGHPLVFAQLLWRGSLNSKHLAATRAQEKFSGSEVQIPISCEHLNSHLISPHGTRVPVMPSGLFKTRKDRLVDRAFQRAAMGYSMLYAAKRRESLRDERR